MKVCLASMATVLAAVFVGSVEGRHLLHLGPAGCVSLYRSGTGSCVISTSCKGKDLSKFEFAFNCQPAEGGNVVRHSYGVGRFGMEELFDTKVQCARCLSPASPSSEQTQAVPPLSQMRLAGPFALPREILSAAQQSAEVKVHEKLQRAADRTQADQTSETWSWFRGSSGQAAASAVSYGPRGCVSTFKSKVGTCIVKTKCSSADLEGYDVGLVCVDKVGVPVRHSFGTASFEAEETFDTLISCDRCLGLGDLPKAVALEGRVMALSEEVGSLKAAMSDLKESVTQLTSKTADTPAAAAPSALTATAQ